MNKFEYEFAEADVRASTEADTQEIQSKLGRMRRRLLDLSRRNRLLNYRATKRSLDIVDELPDEIWSRVVEGGDALTLDPFDEEDEAPPGADLPDAPAPGARPSGRHTDKRLQTPLDSDALDARLSRMASRARGAMQETGINHLYMVLGFLEWFESDDSEVSSIAPLILIPVALSRGRLDPKTRCYRYTVEYTGEDIATNVSLQRKLRDDFAIELPEIDEDVSPETYFEQVRESIRSRRRWVVKRRGCIAFFSFHKLLMYLDLDDERWPADDALSAHPVVASIMAGGETSDAPEFGEEFEIDGNPEAEAVPLVLDADSSQHSALMAALQGNNVVVEGPPGTGKSQTISNLIAAAMAQGQTVLFVSEKLAALEVVKRNLDSVGLGDFCLELHSHKVQKRALLENVGQRIKKRYPRSSGTDIRQQLQETRRELSEYTDAIRRAVGPRGETFEECVWIRDAARGRAGGDIDLSMPTDDAVDPDMLGRCEDNVAGLSHCIAEAGLPSESPWYGVNAAAVVPGHERHVYRSMKNLAQACRSLVQALRSVTREGAPLSGELKDLRSLSKLPAELFATCPSACPVDTLAALAVPGAREVAQELLVECNRYEDLRARAGASLPESVLGDAEAIGALEGHADGLVGLGVGTRSLAQLTKWSQALRQTAGTIRDCEPPPSAVAVIPAAEVRTLVEIETVCAVGHAVVNVRPVVEEAVQPSHFTRAARAALDRGTAQAEQLASLRMELDDALVVSALPPPDELETVRAALHGRQGRLLSWFSGDYRRARRRVRTMVRDAKDAGSRALPRLLEDAIEWQRDCAEFRDDESIAEPLGRLFSGVDTDWEHATQVVEYCQELAAAGGSAEAGQAIAAASEDIRSEWGVCADRLFRAHAAAESNLDKVQPVLRRLRLPTELLLDDDAPAAAVASRLEGIADRIDVHLTALSSIGISMALAPEDGQAALKCARQALDLSTRINEFPAYRSAVASLFQGVATDRDLLADALAWYVAWPDNPAVQPLLQWIAEDSRRRLDLVQRCRAESIEGLRTFSQALDRTRQLVDLNLTEFVGADDGDNVALEHWHARAQACVDGSSQLAAWADYCRLAQSVRDLGFGWLVDAAAVGDVAAEHLRDAVHYRIYDVVVRTALEETPELQSFLRHRHESLIEKYRRLDVELIEAQRQDVAASVAGRPKPAGQSGTRVGDFTETKLLKHEISKKRRHIPVRQLVRRAGRALQALKPCFMMSPLSVAQFLPPDGLRFDLMIMDEASQVRPEDAIGAIARARQAVVVGDPKQLPPTDFWAVSFDTSAEEEDELTAAEETESILDLFLNCYRPIRRLRWHYRSQHESLIEFSNRRFYDDDLVVFPSRHEDAPHLGVHLHHVEGGTFAGGKNVREAERIADAVVEHAMNANGASLGVVAFNRAQADLIEELVEKRAKEDVLHRDALERLMDDPEPLLIKNLENIQGDERDRIIISGTYGPDPQHGKVAQRFGPVNSASGWRRLNVMVTRARQRIDVYTAMRPTDIVPGSNRGRDELRKYWEFADTGRWREAGMETGRSPDSPFEEAVIRELERMGYEGVPQVGVGGFFIDIGVRHPERPEEFMLGIECDGAKYHSSKSARDRDRLRQEILEARGWTIHRIWSTSWYKQRESECNRLRTQLSGTARR